MRPRASLTLCLLAILTMLVASCDLGDGPPPAVTPPAPSSTISPPISEPTATRGPQAATVQPLPGMASPTGNPALPSPTLALQISPATPLATSDSEESPASRLASLPISFPIMSAEMAAYFNQIARPDDVALIPSSQLKLLSSITSGNRRVGFPSWSEAEKVLPQLASQIEIIAYNPEHWEQTPEEEKADLPATVARASEKAHESGLLFMVSPDRRFARDQLEDLAPYADLIGLQGQRIQNDPQAFESWARELIAVARASNPDVRIFVQVGATQGTAAQMYTAIETIAHDIDGISIWTNLRTFDTLQEFVTLIRPSGG